MCVPELDDHWEHLYATRPSTEVSWYQRLPATSVRLVESSAPGPSGAVVDIGGGTSSLVDHLSRDGYTDLTLLDISEHALDEVRRRLGDRSARVNFVHYDVLKWEPERRYDVWHDRAVFHFLTDATDRDRYVDVASRALRDGGIAIVATFADDGPTHCSGLPVSRYSPADLDAAFAAAFSPLRHEREEHITPAGVVQPFTWAVLRRV